MLESRETLALIVPKGEGYKRVASLRSLLSKERLAMKNSKTRYIDFGTFAHIMPWTESDGSTHEAILLRLYRDARHVAHTIFQERQV
jgi:hypothetical protein